jgi:hypothetical protein
MPVRLEVSIGHDYAIQGEPVGSLRQGKRNARYAAVLAMVHPGVLDKKFGDRARVRQLGVQKGIYVRRHTDLTWSSNADFYLQLGDATDRMRHRYALVSIARQRHLDRRSSRCPDGRARYAYRIANYVFDLRPVPGTAKVACAESMGKPYRSLPAGSLRR